MKKKVSKPAKAKSAKQRFQWSVRLVEPKNRAPLLPVNSASSGK